MHSRKHRKRRVLAVATVTMVGWALVSFAAAYKLTERARPPFPEPAPDVSAELGAQSPWRTVTEHRFTTRDNQQIGAWLFHPETEGAGDSVLVLHGNGGSRSQALRSAGLHLHQGRRVLAISLRCHGDSTGEWNDFGRSAALDILAAVDFLETSFPGEGIVLHGLSLGAAAATFAAAELGRRVEAYILECPYRDLRTAVLNRTRHYLPPVLDHLAYWSLLTFAPLVLDEVDRIAPIEHIGAIPESVPTLLLGGERDHRSTVADLRALQRAAPHSQLVVFPGARHLELHRTQPELYKATILGVLEKTAR